MKNHLTFNNILIAVVLIYSIVTVERLIGNKTHQTELIMQHNKNYMQIHKDLDAVNNKIKQYELKMLQNNIDIVNMSNVERDSLRSMLNPR